MKIEEIAQEYQKKKKELEELISKRQIQADEVNSLFKLKSKEVQNKEKQVEKLNTKISESDKQIKEREDKIVELQEKANEDLSKFTQTLSDFESKFDIIENSVKLVLYKNQEIVKTEIIKKENLYDSVKNLFEKGDYSHITLINKDKIKDLKRSDFLLDEKKTVEGGIITEVKNFPDRLQKALNIAKDSDKWFPFVLQWHYRGDSLHCDMRLGCPAEQGTVPPAVAKLEHCEGFTLLSPTSTDKSIPDLINKEDFKNVRCLLKDSHNIDALKKEGIFDKEVYLIVGKGIYKPLIVEDHRIILEFKTYNGEINNKVFEEAEKEGIEINRKPGDKLKSLPDCINFHIAHIDDRWIILADKTKKEDIKVT